MLPATASAITGGCAGSEGGSASASGGRLGVVTSETVARIEAVKKLVRAPPRGIARGGARRARYLVHSFQVLALSACISHFVPSGHSQSSLQMTAQLYWSAKPWISQHS